jgi:hypothetical protein
VRFWQFYKISRIIAVFSIAVFIGCNGSAFAWQVFAKQEGLYIYWSGECTGGISCLFRARRLPNGSYGEETLIARAETLSPSPGDVIAVGEMSITADGRFLYFVYIQYNGATDLELGIAVARKP